tara:strand:- start:170 stop:451 length:282 start_codon:yes stop_codon:yes gene_type:complete
MNIHDLFTAKTEQQLSDIVKSNDGFLELHSAMHFEEWNEFIVDVGNDIRISRPGKVYPSTVIYFATLTEQSLKITCTTNGISLFVNSIEESTL